MGTKRFQLTAGKPLSYTNPKLEIMVTKRSDDKKMKNSIRRKVQKTRNWEEERRERMSSEGR